MKKLKYIFSDPGSILAMVFLSILFTAFTIYEFFSYGWLIVAIIYTVLITAIIKDRINMYNRQRND